MIFEIDVNMTQNKVPPNIKVSQYDNTIPTIEATLWDDEVLYDIPDGSRVYIEGTKADGTGFQYLCEWSGSKVTAAITQQMCAFKGRVECEFVIKNGDERKGTQNFFLLVEPAALNEDVTISESDIPLIERLDDALNTLDETIEDAEAWARGTRSGVDVDPYDETYHNNSKYYAEYAENIGQQKVDEAESWAIRSAAYADDSKDYAENAKDALEETRIVAGATTFSVNFNTGNLEYTSPNYTFMINETTGNLEWEVAA